MNDRPVTRTELLEALSATKSELLDTVAATKSELLDTLAATKSELLDSQAATKTELFDALAANKAEIVEVVRDAQTEVLRAFFTYQQGQPVKFQHLEADLGNTTVAMRKRMDILEQRLAEIYQRILPIPPAA